MMRVMPFAAVGLILASCATGGDPKPAVCDGKHRRPANLYGSVLPIAPAPATPGSANPTGSLAQPEAATGAAPTLGPQSSIDLKSVLPCGSRA